jgi:hypothetical protein
MNGAPSGFDPQQLWQARPTVHAPVSLADIQARAINFQNKARRQRMLTWVLVAMIAVMVWIVWRLGRHGDWLMQLGEVLSLSGVLYGLWRWRRINAFGPLPQAGEALVEAYRNNLIRLRDGRRNIIGIYAPAVAGTALIYLSSILSPNRTGRWVAADHLVVVLIAVIVGLIVLVGWLLNQREADRLQRKIDEL